MARSTDRYLGGNIERVQTKDGSVAWSLSCYDYRQVEDELSQRNLTLKHFGTGLRPYPACYKPEVDTSVLNKRHNAICYHRVREAQAAGIMQVGWIEGEKNVADLFTKTTLSNESKRRFVQFIFDDISTPLPRT